jgi:hypothetical protein
LNEFIAIKSELGILVYHDDENYTGLTNWQITVENDELKITRSNDDKIYFEYYIESKECQRVQKTLFHEKQRIIENCLFGVDINLNSVKICRLRLWIELLKNAYYNDDRKLETLPNIDINIQCGNSLISRFKLDEDLKKHKAKIEVYKSSISAYQSVTDKVEKRAIEKTLTELKDEFFKGLIADSAEKIKLKDLKTQLKKLNNLDVFNTKEKQIQKIELEIAKIESTINNKVYENAFEWRFIFPEVLNTEGDFIGFDIVIGNPPYIQIQNFSGQDIQIVLQNSGYETFERTGDIYALFIEKGISLLRQNGLLSFITSNKWMRAGYGQSLRGFLATKTQPLKLIDFAGFQVFGSATVDSNILMTQKTESALPFVACTIQKDYNSEIDLTTYFAAHSQQMPLMSANAWVISSDIEQQIKAKIEAVGTPLKEWNIHINYGIKTGLNEAFIIDTETKERLCLEDSNSAKIIKPVLRGRDIKKYSVKWAGLWLINSHNNPPVKIEDYPAIKKHLDKFYSQLEERSDKGATPYNLRNCAYLKEFETKKIVYNDICQSLTFSIVEQEIFFNNTVYFISGNFKFNYLIAVLNSKLIDWYYRNLSVQLGEKAIRMFTIYVKQIPIPQLSITEQKPFIKLVDKILKAKKSKQNTHDLEAQIDRLVYDLYGLNKAEIAIIETANC